MTSIPSTTATFATDQSASTTNFHILQLLCGLFFSLRIAITYVSFQSNPRLGTVITFLIGGTILFLAVLVTAGDTHFRALSHISTLRWVAAYLTLCAVSVFWTQASSPAAAAGYCVVTFVDVVVIALLIHSPQQIGVLFQGFVLGALLLVAIAWVAPTLPDGRIGNDDFLHPNSLGLQFALAFFLAQHLSPKHRFYRYAAIILAVSLMRTLSKTSIAAFFIAEGIYLLTNPGLTRRLKIRAIALGSLIVLAFLALSQTYLSSYVTSPDGSETLTGRTVIWAASWLIAVEAPWLGHGIYSYPTLIPFFGPFQPRHAHNELLQQFFDYGLLGVTLTIALYASIMRTARHRLANPYARLTLILAIFALIRGFADTINFDLSLPLWLFTALSIGLDQQRPVVAHD